MASIGDLVSNIGNSISRTLSAPSPKYTRVRSSAPTTPRESFRDSFKSKIDQSFTKFKEEKQDARNWLKTKTADLAKSLDQNKDKPGFQIYNPEVGKSNLTKLRSAVPTYQDIPLSVRKGVVDALSTPAQRQQWEQRQPVQKQTLSQALETASSKDSVDRFKDLVRGQDTRVRQIPGTGFLADISAGYGGSILDSAQKAAETFQKNTDLVNDRTQGMSLEEKIQRQPEIDEALNLLRGGWEVAKTGAKMNPLASAAITAGGGAFNVALGDKEQTAGTRFGEGAAEGAGLMPILKFTNPATEWLIGKLVPGGGSFLLDQIAKRSIAGGANVGEDRIINYLDNTPEKINDVYSFLFAFALNGNDDVLKVISEELQAGRNLSQAGEIPASIKEKIIGRILGAQDQFERGKQSFADRLDNFTKNIAEDYKMAMENSGKEGGFIDVGAKVGDSDIKAGEVPKSDAPKTRAERVKVRKDYATKVLNNSETVEEALFNIRGMVNDARFAGIPEDFQALKQALKEYKSTLTTGPGLPRNPEYDALFDEIDTLLATRIKDFKLTPADVEPPELSRSMIDEDQSLGEAMVAEEPRSNIDQAIEEQGATTTPDQARYEQEALSPTGRADDIVEETNPVKEVLKKQQEDFVKQQEAQRAAEAESVSTPRAEDPEIESLRQDAQKAIFGEDVDSVKEKYQSKKPEKVEKEVFIDPNETKIEGPVIESVQRDAEFYRQLEKQQGQPKDKLGYLKMLWDDEFYFAKKIDPITHTTMRLLSGGGDRLAARVIENNVGAALNAEAEAGRVNDFAALLTLDKTKELIERGFKRKLGMGDVTRGYEELQKKYSPEELAEMNAHADEFRGFMKKLLNQAEEAGFISKEAAEDIRENNQFYVTFDSLGKMVEETTEKGWWSSDRSFTQKSFNVAKQDIINKIGDDTSGVANSIESSLKYMVNVIGLVEKNKMLNSLIERRGARFEGGKLVNPDGSDNIILIPMKQAENVRESIRLSKEIKELVPIKNKIERLTKTRERSIRKLNSAINKLNQEGLLYFLKQPVDTMPEKLVSSVDEKQRVPGITVVTDTEDKFFVRDETRPITRKLEQNYAVQGSRGKQSTKRFVESLIQQPKSEIERIHRKIGTRDQKVNALFEEIKVLSEDLDIVKDQIVDLRIQRGELANITEVPAGYEKINRFKDGIKEEWAVVQELAVPIKNLDAKQSGYILDVWNKIFVRPSKQLFTQLNPAFFAVTNPIKDLGNTFVTKSTTDGIRSGAELMGNYVLAMKDSFGVDPNKVAWELSGGSNAGLMGAEIRTDPSKYISELTEKPRKILQILNKPIQAGEVLEQMPRIATFKQGFEKLSKAEQDMVLQAKNGWTPLADLPESVRKLAIESRDISQDFSRAGVIAREVNKVVPFFNAALQGGSKLARLAKNNPGRFVKTMIVSAGIPAISTYLNNREYEDYKDLRDYERYKNAIWIYKDRTPEEVAEGAPLHAFKLPLPQLSQPFYVATETMLRGVDNDDPQAIAQLGTEMAQAGWFTAGELSPMSDVTSFIPTPVKSKMQLDANQDFYSGFEIEPKYIDTDGDGEGDTPREDVPPAYRKGYYTGPTTETLGRLTGPTIGISPAQLDNIISTTTGGTGRFVTSSIDTALGKDEDLSTNPITKKLIYPRGGQIKSDEYAAEDKLKMQEAEEEFGGPGINLENLSYLQSSASDGTTPVANQKVKTSDMQEISAMGPGEGVSTEVKEASWFGKLFGKQPEVTKVYDPGALVEDASTDSYDVRAIRGGATITIPKKQTAFSDKYSEMEKIFIENEEKIDEINFDDTLKDSEKAKKLKELQEKFDLASQAKQIMEENYPEQVFEAGLDAYGKGSDLGVENRGDWVVTQLDKLIAGDLEKKGSDEWQAYVNRMWETGVLTGKSTGTLQYIIDTYGLETSDFKYTGDDDRIAKTASSATSGGGKKFNPVAVKTPSVKLPSFDPLQIQVPDLSKLIQAYEKNGFIPVKSSSYGGQTPEYLRVQQPKAELKTPTIQSERIKIKGL